MDQITLFESFAFKAVKKFDPMKFYDFILNLIKSIPNDLQSIFLQRVMIPLESSLFPVSLVWSLNTGSLKTTSLYWQILFQLLQDKMKGYYYQLG